MKNIIITTPEELEGLIQSSITNAFRQQEHCSKLANPEQEYLTLPQASVLLRLAPQTIYGLTSKNLIPFFKSGKKLLFVKSTLEKWQTDGGNCSKNEVRTDSQNINQ